MDNTGSYITEGISRKDRDFAQLHPHYFQMDERSVDDLLLFITELSFEYNFFDESNNLAGNWLDFFLSDANLVLRVFQHFDFKRYFLEYGRRKQELSIEADEDALKVKLKKLVDWIYKFLSFQKRMFDSFQSAVTSSDLEKLGGKDLDNLREFTNIVLNDKDYEVARDKFYSLSTHIEGAYNDIRFAIPDRRSFFLRKEVWPDTPFQQSSKSSLYSNVNYTAVKIFDELFSRFALLHSRLIKASDFFFQKQQQDKVSYRPHLSLVLSFLELYQVLKKDLNQYTRKHLDFYYGRLLDITPKKAEGDKVSVIFTLVKGINEHLLKRGEKMMAVIPGQERKETFSLTEDISVNCAKITELKTIYKCKYHQISDEIEEEEAEGDDMIYAADNPVTGIADYFKYRKTMISWPLFGEDQWYLSAGKKSMKEADLGILVASPLFFAEDGKRDFSIKFHLSPLYFTTSFYAHAIKMKVIIAEMLKRAFIIDITGLDKWIRVPEYSTLSQTDEVADAFIDIRFELKKEDPAVGNYQSLVHGSAFDTSLPVVRLMLNNSSFQNPYAYFSKQVIERITIEVIVCESTHLKLKNNIGSLSPSNPFQLFGPQPTQGSFLELKNTNIFNRFTKNFLLQLKWFDLPKNRGGFTAYYKGYGNEITNESFKVGLSGLLDGNFQPKPEEQQVFDLFQMNPNADRQDYLCDTTTVRKVNLHKTRFNNDPLLQQEDTDLNFKNGAIRLELKQPADAFGHKLYPVIFPRILMHNAKLFTKKLPVINPPYIPMLRAIAVDYTLHHSESMTAGKPKAQPDIELWHIYPFGFKKTYPSGKKEEIKFIPTISKDGNLFIGLADITPGKVLNLLFQMEENNFQKLDDENNPVTWSYLDRNEWININETDILEDNTIRFKGTGIIKLMIPLNISKGNTLFNPAYYWLRISSNELIRSKVKAIFTQAAAAMRELETAHENIGSLTLDPFLVKDFSHKIPEILSVIQPFHSYHGKAAETKNQYYTRVSEQLRHKQRLVTSTDISQKILELFPGIHKVICFIDTAGISHGQDLQVVLIPKIQSFNDASVIEPKVDIFTLYKIRSYLKENISPFLTLTVAVRNPEYERIKVVCSVVFRENQTDRSAYLMMQNLNRDICTFISPWLFSEDAEINTNKGIYPSEILNFIKELPYVRFVSGFNVIHFYNVHNYETHKSEARLIDSLAASPAGTGTPGKNLQLVFIGSKPGAILITTANHLIQVIKSGKPGVINEDPVPVPASGIGRLSVGKEFLVMNSGPDPDYPGLTKPALPVAEDEIDFSYDPNP